MSAENTEIPTSVPVLEQNDSRNDLVHTAVKFLQNPKVQSSPLEQKKNFLKKKGLTDAEIDRAVELAGVSTVTPVVENHLSISPHQPIPIQPLPVSGWVRIREYSSLAVLVAGIAYGLYSLYKKFIEPFFLKRQSEEDKKWDKMQKDVSKINTEVTASLQKVQDIVSKLQQQITEQNTKILSMSSNLELYRDAVEDDTSEKAVSTLRGDITSLKGLLLNAKQFPASPAIQPAIPSWQMQPTMSSSSSSLIPNGVLPSSTPTGKFSTSEPRRLPSDVKSENSENKNSGAHRKKNPADLEQDEDEYCANGPLNGEDVPDSTDKLLNGHSGGISLVGTETTTTPEVLDRPEIVIGSPVKPLSAAEDSSVIDDSEID